MLRTPVWATASLLAVAISLAGCGEDKAPAEQAAAPQAATTQSEPAPAAQETVNSEAAQAVVKHYADIAHAVFSDAHSAALKLQDQHYLAALAGDDAVVPDAQVLRRLHLLCDGGGV